jgi:hypothetical protein
LAPCGDSAVALVSWASRPVTIAANSIEAGINFKYRCVSTIDECPDQTGKETRCEISAEADDLLEIAKASLDHAVIARGTQRKDPTRRKMYALWVQEIEVIDQVDSVA